MKLSKYFENDNMHRKCQYKHLVKISSTYEYLFLKHNKIRKSFKLKTSFVWKFSFSLLFFYKSNKILFFYSTYHIIFKDYKYLMQSHYILIILSFFSRIFTNYSKDNQFWRIILNLKQNMWFFLLIISSFYIWTCKWFYLYTNTMLNS